MGILDKQALYRNINPLPHKDRLYNTLSKRALRQLPFGLVTQHINLSVDRSKKNREIVIFNQFIQNNLEVMLPLDATVHISHELSHNNAGLQAVDVFCWGIYRKYEQQDISWYNSFKHRIVTEEIYTR